VVNFDTFKICKEIIHSFTSCCLVQKVADKNNRLTRVYTPAHIHTGRLLRVLITCAKLNLKKMPFTTLFFYSLTLTLSLSHTQTHLFTLYLSLYLCGCKLVKSFRLCSAVLHFFNAQIKVLRHYSFRYLLMFNDVTHSLSGVDFTNFLQAAFMCADSKSAKRHLWLVDCLFCAFGI